MKTKTVFVITLALVLCFSFTLVTMAATSSPKDLVLKSIDSLDLDYSHQFYQQSSGTANYRINRLGGTSLQGINIPPGTALQCTYQLDVPGKKSVFDVNLNYGSQTYNGQFFLSADKMIFTKSFLQLAKDLGGETGDLSRYPDYLYISNPAMSQLWETMLSYPNARITEETKDLLKFFVEAVPAEYFTLTGTTITLQLDQEGFEETVYRILDKVKNEKQRFAEIVATMATTYDTTGAVGSPQQMQREIINGIDQMVQNGNWPSREEVAMLGGLVRVKSFRYSAPVIPGGRSTFEAALALQPETGFTGQLDISSASSGPMDNLTGTYSFKLNFSQPGGTIFNGSFNGDIAIKDDTITQNIVLSALAQKAGGAVDFDVQISGSTKQQVAENLVINVPVLTAQNSLNLDQQIGQGIGVIGGASGPTTVVVPSGKITIFVNNRPVATDAEPFMQNGRLMVPIRFVSQSLNADVRWIDPNVIRITRGDRVISMFAGETSYILDGQPAKMDTVPVLKNGRTFVPVRFVAEALNCKVNYLDNKVYINSD